VAAACAWGGPSVASAAPNVANDRTDARRKRFIDLDMTEPHPLELRPCHLSEPGTRHMRSGSLYWAFRFPMFCQRHGGGGRCGATRSAGLCVPTCPLKTLKTRVSW